MKLVLFPFAMIFATIFVFCLNSCGNPDMKKARRYENQPTQSDLTTVLYYAEVAGPYLDEVTIPVTLCGGSRTYVRYLNKDSATLMLKPINDHKRVQVTLRLVEPYWYQRWHIFYEVVTYKVLPPEIKMCPCDSLKTVHDTVVQKISNPRKNYTPAPLPSRATKTSEGSVEFSAELTDGTKIEFKSVGGLQRSEKESLPQSPIVPKADSIPRPGATVPVPQ